MEPGARKNIPPPLTVYKSATFQTSSITQLARPVLEPFGLTDHLLWRTDTMRRGEGEKKTIPFITTDSSITTKWNQPSGPDSYSLKFKDRRQQGSNSPETSLTWWEHAVEQFVAHYPAAWWLSHLATCRLETSPTFQTSPHTHVLNTTGISPFDLLGGAEMSWTVA